MTSKRIVLVRLTSQNKMAYEKSEYIAKDSPFLEKAAESNDPAAFQMV